MDLTELRTFVTVARTGNFQAAADDLKVSQQAVSKRIAALEKHLGVALLVRTPRGSRLTLDGRVFLPHARKVLAAMEQGERAVRPGSRPLRVDVLNRRIAPAQAVYEYFRHSQDAEVDAVTLDAQTPAQVAGSILEGAADAAFRAIPAEEVPAGIRAERLLDAPLQILVGPSHPLAAADRVRPHDLVGHRIWIPGIRTGTEWAGFYGSLADEFGLSIDAIGPHFGDEALLDVLADSAELATLVGVGDRYLWPESYDLRRIPLQDPVPLYPHVLLTRKDDQHPVLAGFRGFLRSRSTQLAGPTWVPGWVGG